MKWIVACAGLVFSTGVWADYASTVDSSGCWVARDRSDDRCLVAKAEWSSSTRKKLIVKYANQCDHRIFVHMCHEQTDGDSDCGNFGLPAGRSKTWYTSNSNGNYTYMGVGSEQQSNDWMCSAKYPDLTDDIETAAKQGHVAAMSALADKYRYGKGGVDKDLVQAAFWANKAARQGDTSARWLLVELYKQGLGVQRDYDKAIYWLERIREKPGDTTPSLIEERIIYLKSEKEREAGYARANSGSPADQRSYAELLKKKGYDNSENDPKLRPVYWYERAANGGDVESQLIAGELYADKGSPLDRDKSVFDFVDNDATKSLRYFEMAARQGNLLGQLRTAMAYASNGAEQNLSTAAVWYEKAVGQGPSDALLYAADFYLTNSALKKGDRGIELLEQAAEAGSAVAMAGLANFYEQGRFVKKNQETADEWFRRASKKGHPFAMYRHAQMLMNGSAADKEDAFRRFDAAARGGVTEAKYQAGLMQRDGIGTRVNKREALRWFYYAKKDGHPEAAKEFEKLRKELGIEEQ